MSEPPRSPSAFDPPPDVYAPPTTEGAARPARGGFVDAVRWILIAIDLLFAAYLLLASLLAITRLGDYPEDMRAMFLGTSFGMGLSGLILAGGAWGIYKRRRWGWALQFLLLALIVLLGYGAWMFSRMKL